MTFRNLISSALRSGVNALVREGTRAATKAATSALRKRPSGDVTPKRHTTRSTNPIDSRKEDRTGHGNLTASRTAQDARHTNMTYPRSNEHPDEWDVLARGLPNLSYSPEKDGQPDPGEIVWTWVPYEEDETKGKDRPVLVISMDGDYVIFLQLTSKDHADNGIYQDKYGTWWMDIGSGEWDSKGRASEAKLSKLWIVHESQIRRAGGVLRPDIYRKVVTALTKIHV